MAPAAQVVDDFMSVRPPTPLTGGIAMAKPELGQKRVCVACSTRFYDLGRAPAICPKCGTEQPAEQPRLRRGGGNVTEDKRPKKIAAVADDVEVDVEVAEEADEDVLADDAEDDDADAIPEELEVDPEADERG
jgi:uncharacterized protein (TIGR02300 family)